MRRLNVVLMFEDPNVKFNSEMQFFAEGTCLQACVPRLMILNSPAALLTSQNLDRVQHANVLTLPQPCRESPTSTHGCSTWLEYFHLGICQFWPEKHFTQQSVVTMPYGCFPILAPLVNGKWKCYHQYLKEKPIDFAIIFLIIFTQQCWTPNTQEVRSMSTKHKG